VSYTPTSNAVRVVADAFRKDAASAVNDACHAAAPPPAVAVVRGGLRLEGSIELGEPGGRVESGATYSGTEPRCERERKRRAACCQLVAAASSVFKTYLYIESRVTKRSEIERVFLDLRDAADCVPGLHDLEQHERLECLGKSERGRLLRSRKRGAGVDRVLEIEDVPKGAIISPPASVREAARVELLLTAGYDAHEVVRGVTPLVRCIRVHLATERSCIRDHRLTRAALVHHEPVASNCSAVGSLATAPAKATLGLVISMSACLHETAETARDDPA
jgi:hypothetical protein